MSAIAWAPLILYLVELTSKIVAIGTVPGNRRPSSSIAWLLLIIVTPILGLGDFLSDRQSLRPRAASQGPSGGE